MTALRVDVLGIGAWAVGLEGWSAVRAEMRAALRGDAAHATIDANRASRPSPAMLPAAERRRAPESVAVALEVAREAVGMASATHAIDASSLASVFASAHGDLAIVDYLCATLASDPTSLSPTRFHHSVLNAAAGYWSIAMHDTGPASAIAAGDESFAAGLLEAATQACAEDRPVLLVAFDTPAVGPLRMAAANTALFGIAMVIVPAGRSASSALAGLAIDLFEGATPPPLPRAAPLRALAASSPSARALALAEVIACVRDDKIAYPLTATTTSLSIRVLANADDRQSRAS